MTTWWQELKNRGWLSDVNKNYEWHNTYPATDTFEEFLHKEFDDDYGGIEGDSFVILTKDWIYFPICYDGAEWIERVPRYPNDTFIPHHFGGG